jgi:hypothetical protein
VNALGCLYFPFVSLRQRGGDGGKIKATRRSPDQTWKASGPVQFFVLHFFMCIFFFVVDLCSFSFVYRTIYPLFVPSIIPFPHCLTRNGRLPRLNQGRRVDLIDRGLMNKNLFLIFLCTIHLYLFFCSLSFHHQFHPSYFFFFESINKVNTKEDSKKEQRVCNTDPEMNDTVIISN